MFFEVRILDENGNIKKVISSKKLSARFWKLNDNGQQDFIQKPVIEDDEHSLGRDFVSRGVFRKKPSSLLDDSFE